MQITEKFWPKRPAQIGTYLIATAKTIVAYAQHLSSRLAQANLVDERAGVAVVAVLVVALGSSTRSSTSTSTRSIISSSSTTTTSRRSARSASSRNGAFGRTVWVAQICLTEATQERLGFSS